MSNAARVRMTLTGAMAGKTVTLNNCRFVSGVCEDIIHVQDAEGLRKYFTRSYSVKFEINPRDEVAQEETGDEVLPEMDERQLACLEALHAIPQHEWDHALPVPRPAVSRVADLANDPHLTMEELITVCEVWYGKVELVDEVEEADEVEEVEEVEEVDEVEEAEEAEEAEEVRGQEEVKEDDTEEEG